MTALAVNDAPQLDERQARKLIARINANIEDVASLLIQLYYGKGWAAMGYTSWSACCKEEFGKSASWACRQIKASEQRAALPMATDDAAEIPEAHLRELRKAGGSQRQAEAWETATGRHGPDVTARQVAEVVAEQNTIDVEVEAAEQETEEEDEELETDETEDDADDSTDSTRSTCPNCGETRTNDSGECSICHRPKAIKLDALGNLLDECVSLYGDDAVEAFLTEWFDSRHDKEVA